MGKSQRAAAAAGRAMLRGSGRAGLPTSGTGSARTMAVAAGLRVPAHGAKADARTRRFAVASPGETGLKHTPYGAQGSGFYTDATRGCFDVLARLTGPVLEACQAMLANRAASRDFSPFRIMDLGTADAGTSLPLVRKCVALIRKAPGFESVPIEVLYEDQPGNDWVSVFARTQGTVATPNVPEEAGGLTDFKDVFVLASGTSFYQTCCAPGTVDVAFCATAFHWLTSSPSAIPDALHSACTEDPATLERYRRQADEDWRRIMSARGRELRPGARLMVANFAKDANGHFLGFSPRTESMHHNFARIWKDLVTPSEFEATNFPNHYRSLEECSAPFGGEGGVFAGLKLLSAETAIVPCPYLDSWLADPTKRTAAEQSKYYVPTTRTWSNSTFLAGLGSHRSAEEKEAMVDAMYEAYAEHVAKDPSRHGMDYVHSYLVLEGQAEGAAGTRRAGAQGPAGGGAFGSQARGLSTSARAPGTTAERQTPTASDRQCGRETVPELSSKASARKAVGVAGGRGARPGFGESRRSYSSSSSAARRGFSSAGTTRTPADVLIVGSGIMGMNIAYQMKRRDPSLNVTILERAPALGFGSSGWSTGFLRAFYSFDNTMELALDGINAYKNWGDYTGLGDKAEAYFTHTGALWMLGKTKEANMAIHERLKKYSVKSEVMDAAAISKRFPALSTEPYPEVNAETGDLIEKDWGECWAVYEDGCGHMDSSSCLRDIHQACEREGVSIVFNTRVAEVLTNAGGDRAEGVKLMDGSTVKAGTVLNCAGPWFQQLNSTVGVRTTTEMLPTRIQVGHKALPDDEDLLSLPFVADYWGNSGIYFMPRRANKQLVFGSVSHRFESETVDPDDFNEALDPDVKQDYLSCLFHRCPTMPQSGHIQGFSHMYTVNQEDVHPVIGASAEIGNYFLCNGFSGHGFKLAPAVGSLVAQQVLGSKTERWETSIPLDFLDPSRKPLALQVKTHFA